MQSAGALADLAEMFLKRMLAIHQKGKDALELYRAKHQSRTDALVLTLRDLVVAYGKEGTTDERLTAGHVCWQIMDRKLAQQVFIRLEQRESELFLDDATTRYLKFRADYPGLEDRVKQQHIASYLGITPVTLSRIRSQLSRS